MQQLGQHSIPKYVMQHFRFASDKRFKILKEGLMHPRLAFVAEKVSLPENGPVDTNTFGGWTYPET